MNTEQAKFFKSNASTLTYKCVSWNNGILECKIIHQCASSLVSQAGQSDLRMESWRKKLFCGHKEFLQDARLPRTMLTDTMLAEPCSYVTAKQEFKHEKNTKEKAASADPQDVLFVQLSRRTNISFSCILTQSWDAMSGRDWCCPEWLVFLSAAWLELRHASHSISALHGRPCNHAQWDPLLAATPLG